MDEESSFDFCLLLTQGYAYLKIQAHVHIFFLCSFISLFNNISILINFSIVSLAQHLRPPS